jgi:co-chaperonin GroES (HSP10)
MIENFYSDFADEESEVETHAPFTPINDFILVKRFEEDNTKTKGGLFIADKFQQPSNRGTVIAIGHKVTAPVQQGDILTFGAANTEFLEIKDEEFLLLRESDIRGVEKAL